jgi:hypothetical protein
MRDNHFDLLKSFVWNERGNSEFGRRQFRWNASNLWEQAAIGWDLF